MVGNNAYFFGYHDDADARRVAAIFCQRAGGQLTKIGGGFVADAGLDLNNFQYADSSFTIQPFNPRSQQDITLNILTGINCQR